MNKRLLTGKEEIIFNKLLNNKTTKQIANDLNISEKTVRNHISNVIQKLAVENRLQAILELIKLKQIKFKE